MRFGSLAKRNPKAAPFYMPSGQVFTVPPATGGWNTRDPLDAMHPNDAVILDNYFPTTGNVQLRGGSSQFATGLGVGRPVETIMEYVSGVSLKRFAACNGNIYDVTTLGAVGAASVSGLTNNRWQHTVFSTSGTTRIVMVNGIDTMYQYDPIAGWVSITGASVPAITGVATTTLVNVWQFKRRLFFIQKNTMSAWCLDPDTFGGAAHQIDLGSLFEDGGYLVAGGTWTRDGGNGENNLCVFITNRGEVAIYMGDDPTNANSWYLVGKYRMGYPLGYRCLIPTGADLAVITTDGILGLSNVLSLDRAASNKVALSNKICGVYNSSATMYGNNFGWEAVSYPSLNQVLFNIPVQENTTQVQYVLNTLTGAWCRFTGLNANCWILSNNRIYFGDNNGTVWLADDTQADNGIAINGLIKTAFQAVGNPVSRKVARMVRAKLLANVGVAFGVDTAWDYDDKATAPIIVSPGASGLSIWNVATWNVDPWDTLVLLKKWQSAKGSGNTVSIIFATQTAGFAVQSNGFDFLYENAGVL